MNMSRLIVLKVKSFNLNIIQSLKKTKATKKRIE